MSTTTYFIEGKVIRGNQLGRNIGFPTANLSLPSLDSPLNKGVYGVSVTYCNKDYFGVMNVGIRPTINDNEKISHEVYLIDFDQNIYGEYLKVMVHFFIRYEFRFPNLSMLVEQIHQDIEYTKKRFILQTPFKDFNENEEKQINSDIIRHLPDLSFVRFCEDEFKVNRGIYNVIDTWFFNKGKIDIVERREKILSFLKYINNSSKSKNNGSVIIGRKGLTSKLNEFWEKIHLLPILNIPEAFNKQLEV